MSELKEAREAAQRILAQWRSEVEIREVIVAKALLSLLATSSGEREILEKAARVAETFTAYTGYGQTTEDSWTTAYVRGNKNAAECIAAAIRALCPSTEDGK